MPLHYQSHYDCSWKPCKETGLGLDAGIALPYRTDRASTDPFFEPPKPEFLKIGKEALVPPLTVKTPLKLDEWADGLPPDMTVY